MTMQKYLQTLDPYEQLAMRRCVERLKDEWTQYITRHSQGSIAVSKTDSLRLEVLRHYADASSWLHEVPIRPSMYCERNAFLALSRRKPTEDVPVDTESERVSPNEESKFKKEVNWLIENMKDQRLGYRSGEVDARTFFQRSARFSACPWDSDYWLQLYTDGDDERKQILRIIVAIYNNGYIKSDDLKGDSRQNTSQTQFSASAMSNVENRYDECKITVVRRDCVNLAISLRTKVSQSSKILLLNMASDRGPGGGYLHGMQAQEEELFRRSNYANFLIMENLPSNGKITLTKNVTFFRDGDSNGYEIYNTRNRVQLDCVAAAALDLRQPENNQLSDNKKKEIIESKIANLLRFAYEHKYSTLVLSAWGCGAYRNDAKTVSESFEKELKKYKHGFQEVYFAIIGSNFNTFQQTFARKSVENNEEPLEWGFDELLKDASRTTTINPNMAYSEYTKAVWDADKWKVLYEYGNKNEKEELMRAVALHNTVILHKSQYDIRQKTVKLKHLQNSCQKWSEVMLKEPKKRGSVLEVFVSSMDSVSAVIAMTKKFSKPVLLWNMANHSPTEGYKSGIESPEEDLFRRSNYYHVMDDESFHQSNLNVFVSRHVQIFREDCSHGYALLDNPVEFTCIDCVPQEVVEILDPWVKKSMQIECILKAAILCKAKAIVLPAYGCGLLKHDASLTAKAFQETLKKLEHDFEYVCFAIEDTKTREEFKKMFPDAQDLKSSVFSADEKIFELGPAPAPDSQPSETELKTWNKAFVSRWHQSSGDINAKSACTLFAFEMALRVAYFKPEDAFSVELIDKVLNFANVYHGDDVGPGQETILEDVSRYRDNLKNEELPGFAYEPEFDAESKFNAGPWEEYRRKRIEALASAFQEKCLNKTNAPVTCVLTSNGYSMAVLYHKSEYWAFDSHNSHEQHLDGSHLLQFEGPLQAFELFSHRTQPHLDHPSLAQARASYGVTCTVLTIVSESWRMPLIDDAEKNRLEKDTKHAMEKQLKLDTKSPLQLELSSGLRQPVPSKRNTNNTKPSSLLLHTKRDITVFLLKNDDKPIMSLYDRWWTMVSEEFSRKTFYTFTFVTDAKQAQLVFRVEKSTNASTSQKTWIAETAKMSPLSKMVLVLVSNDQSVTEEIESNYIVFTLGRSSKPFNYHARLMARLLPVKSASKADTTGELLITFVDLYFPKNAAVADEFLRKATASLKPAITVLEDEFAAWQNRKPSLLVVFAEGDSWKEVQSKRKDAVDAAYPKRGRRDAPQSSVLAWVNGLVRNIPKDQKNSVLCLTVKETTYLDESSPAASNQLWNHMRRDNTGYKPPPSPKSTTDLFAISMPKKYWIGVDTSTPFKNAYPMSPDLWLDLLKGPLEDKLSRTVVFSKVSDLTKKQTIPDFMLFAVDVSSEIRIDDKSLRSHAKETLKRLGFDTTPFLIVIGFNNDTYKQRYTDKEAIFSVCVDTNGTPLTNALDKDATTIASALLNSAIHKPLSKQSHDAKSLEHVKPSTSQASKSDKLWTRFFVAPVLPLTWNMAHIHLALLKIGLRLLHSNGGDYQHILNKTIQFVSDVKQLTDEKSKETIQDFAKEFNVKNDRVLDWPPDTDASPEQLQTFIQKRIQVAASNFLTMSEESVTIALLKADKKNFLIFRRPKNTFWLFSPQKNEDEGLESAFLLEFLDSHKLLQYLSGDLRASDVTIEVLVQKDKSTKPSDFCDPSPEEFTGQFVKTLGENEKVFKNIVFTRNLQCPYPALWLEDFRYPWFRTFGKLVNNEEFHASKQQQCDLLLIMVQLPDNSTSTPYLGKLVNKSLKQGSPCDYLKLSLWFFIPFSF